MPGGWHAPRAPPPSRPSRARFAGGGAGIVMNGATRARLASPCRRTMRRRSVSHRAAGEQAALRGRRACGLVRSRGDPFSGGRTCRPRTSPSGRSRCRSGRSASPPSAGRRSDPCSPPVEPRRSASTRHRSRFFPSGSRESCNSRDTPRRNLECLGRTHSDRSYSVLPACSSRRRFRSETGGSADRRSPARTEVACRTRRRR